MERRKFLAVAVVGSAAMAVAKALPEVKNEYTSFLLDEKYISRRGANFGKLVSGHGVTYSHAGKLVIHNRCIYCEHQWELDSVADFCPWCEVIYFKERYENPCEANYAFGTARKDGKLEMVSLRW